MRLIDADVLLKEWDNLSERGRKEFDQVIMTQSTVELVSGREYVEKFGSCPMCMDCPDGCLLEK